MSLFARVKQGAAYMDLWPEEPVLKAVFMEARVKAVFGVAKMVIPPAVALILFWIYYTCGGWQGLYLLLAHPQSGYMHLYLAITSLIIMVMVLLYAPVHVLLWFSYSAERDLNARQKAFYVDLCSQLQRQPSSAPVMYDFVKVLHDACNTLKDREFLNKL